MEGHNARCETVRRGRGWTICQEEKALHGSRDCVLSPHDDACRSFKFVHGVGIEFYSYMIWFNVSKINLRFKVPVWI
jgi:hypothetical protein